MARTGSRHDYNNANVKFSLSLITSDAGSH